MHKIMLLTFTLDLLKKKHLNASCTIKWQTHLPCLHQESLIHSLTSMKTQPVINQHADASPGNRACYVHELSLVERVLSHFLLDPGPMNVTINRPNK